MCPHTPSLWLKVPFLHSSFLAQLLSSVYGFALCFLLLWPTTSTMDGDDDDDEGELLSLIAVNRQCQQRSEPVVGGHIADVAALPEEADDQELLGLVALARQPAARKFENLSWQHTLHCQSAKRLKVSTKIAEQAVAKTAQVETTLAITSCMGGAGLGGRRKAKLNENQYAICQLHLACQQRQAADPAQHYRQAVAACSIADAIDKLQRKCLSESLSGQLASSASGMQGHDVDQVPAPTLTRRIGAYIGSWDETAQRMKRWRNLHEKQAGNEQSSMQVMMQSGGLYRIEVMSDGSCPFSFEPFFVKGSCLERQRASDILEGLLRQIPLPLHDAVSFARLLESNDIVYICFCMDRAAVNDMVTRWLFMQIIRLSVAGGLQCIPCAEYCWPHTMCIAKSRCVEARRKGREVSSFVKQMVDGSFKRALTKQMVDSIEARLEVRHQPPPPECKIRADKLVTTLFCGGDVSYMFVKASGGDLIEKEWVKQVRSYLAVVDLVNVAGPSGKWIHWCWVAADSHAHLKLGKPVGARCCEDFAESVRLVSSASLAFGLGKSWGSSEVDRWTNVRNLLRKWIIGCVGPALLPASLSDLNAHWGSTGSLADSLARLMAADSTDFRVQRKIKLVKICRELCGEGTATEVAIHVLALGIMDGVIYAVLGHGGKRCTMFDLANAPSSPVCKALDQLTMHLSDFGPHADHWLLLVLIGADFKAHKTKLYARRQFLQHLSGLFDVGDRILARPPYSCVHICNSSDRAIKQATAAAFFHENLNCLPLVCKEWRRICVTEAAFLASGPPVVKSYLTVSPTSIDDVERLHSKMRHDLLSHGRGKSFTISSNRVFCSQVAAQHVANGGTKLRAADIVEIAPTPIGNADAELFGTVHATASAPSTNLSIAPVVCNIGPRRGNPLLQLYNIKEVAYKQLVAPDRPLNATDRTKISEAARTEWSQLDLAAKDCYRWVAPHASKREAVENKTKKSFTQMWGASQDPKFAIDPHRLAATCATMKNHSRERAFNDPGLVVLEADTPDRCSIQSDLVETHELHGCYAKKKNVCTRVDHGHSRRQALDLLRLTGILSAFTDELHGRPDSFIADVVIWLRDLDFASATAAASSSDCVPLPSHDMILAMADARLSPKMQLFVPCQLHGAGENEYRLPQFPFDVHLALGSPRMDPTGVSRGLVWFTSDELAAHLLAMAPSHAWGIFELKWTFPDTPSLLDMTIVGSSTRFCPKVSVTKPLHVHWNDELDEPSPFVPESSAPGDDLHSANDPGTSASNGGVHEDGEDVDNDEDANHLLFLAPEDMEDIDNAALAASLAAQELPEVGSGQDECIDDFFEVDVVEGPVEPIPTAGELAAVSVVAASGEVRCDVAPWCGLSRLGRITTWPEDKPMHQRSASMRCALHPNCSVVKKRSTCSDEKLLTWLYSAGVPAAGLSSDERKQLTIDHKKLWTDMWR
jgi:hypothetical protein